MASELVTGVLIAGIFFISALIIQICGTLLADWRTHKRKIRYLKQELIFKEKINIFEKIVGLSWRIHLNLTELDLGTKNKEEIKREINKITNSFLFVFDKAIYINEELNTPLGKYIDLFERYIESKSFGTKKSIEELREKAKPLSDKISEIIQGEINSIK